MGLDLQHETKIKDLQEREKNPLPSKPVEPVKEEAVAAPVAPQDAEKTMQEEVSASSEEKERTPSPPLKVDPNESEAMKDLKAKLK